MLRLAVVVISSLALALPAAAAPMAHGIPKGTPVRVTLSDARGTVLNGEFLRHDSTTVTMRLRPQDEDRHIRIAEISRAEADLAASHAASAHGGWGGIAGGVIGVLVGVVWTRSEGSSTGLNIYTLLLGVIGMVAGGLLASTGERVTKGPDPTPVWVEVSPATWTPVTADSVTSSIEHH
jgi:hypothetical protein